MPARRQDKAASVGGLFHIQPHQVPSRGRALASDHSAVVLPQGGRDSGLQAYCLLAWSDWARCEHAGWLRDEVVAPLTGFKNSRPSQISRAQVLRTELCGIGHVKVALTQNDRAIAIVCLLLRPKNRVFSWD
jgi:hypothetical protein